MVQTFSTASAHAALACVVLAFASVCSADDYDVYLLAGQSNMDGTIGEMRSKNNMPSGLIG
ncbi:hypothetical protein CKO51_11035 [Rhodopirellula sp. SM50]|nr:hypothetical protein [Rhodopirellula sp. SM50]PAY19405.1 hypothetical protein CKO51_11035 [Rhodopirellula sp. SM50]